MQDTASIARWGACFKMMAARPWLQDHGCKTMADNLGKLGGKGLGRGAINCDVFIGIAQVGASDENRQLNTGAMNTGVARSRSRGRCLLHESRG